MNMRRPGLSHSDQHSALMAPFYRGFQASLSLDTDDITAVQVSHRPLCMGDTSTMTYYILLLCRPCTAQARVRISEVGPGQPGRRGGQCEGWKKRGQHGAVWRHLLH